MDKEQLRQKIDFVTFYGEELPSLTHTGGAEASALCPFHEVLSVMSSAISTVANPNSDGVFPQDESQAGLTPEELEGTLAQQYRALIPWTAKKLRIDYGVRDLKMSRSPELLQIVEPIAEELVHDTIVELWIKIKKKRVELHNEPDIHRWLRGALKISLRRWAQDEARMYERRVYCVPIEDEQEVLMCSEVTEPWDTQDKGTLWQTLEEVFDRLLRENDCPSAPSHQEKVTSDELTAAMKYLPSDIQKVVHQVYTENVPWQEASASLNIESRMLQREVQRWLHTVRSYISSYQPSQQPAREDTRRVRKSFHCPVCETKVKRKKGQSGAVCSGCGIGIHKDQFAIKYSYRHA